MTKFLNAEEYNCVVLAIHSSSDYLARGQGSKEQFYKTLFNKLFTIQENDLLKNESVNHPIK